MFPLVAIPIALYSILAPFGVRMKTSFVWDMSLGDLLVAMALLMVAVEIWRSTVASPKTAIRLVADLMVLILCIVEWLAPWSHSGTFVLLTIAAFVNVAVSAYVAFVVKGQNNVWVSSR